MCIYLVCDPQSSPTQIILQLGFDKYPQNLLCVVFEVKYLNTFGFIEAIDAMETSENFRIQPHA